MTDQLSDDRGYTTEVIAERSPAVVFAAIVNARGWWSQNIQGDTAAANPTRRSSNDDRR